MSITFTTCMNPTPFGFFDSSPAFQTDADKMVTYVLRKQGNDVLSVELTKKMIWSCFEEATLQFNANIIEYQAKSNLTNLLGTPTGSIDPETGQSTINLTNTYIRPNLEFLIRQAEPYAAEIGYGQSMDSYSGSIELKLGQQDYNIYTELKDENGIPLSNYMPSGSEGRMKVLEVYHFAPVQYLYNSNMASNFVAAGMPLESWVPDTRFYILPVFEDVLRGHMINTAQKVRRSHYSYRVSGRHLRLYPTPSYIYNGYNNKVWIRVAFPPSADPNLILSGTDGQGGSWNVSGSSGIYPGIPDSTLWGASNPANIPMGLINYDSLNPWAKNWIYQYTFALCTELLGRVRSKVKTIPIPDTDLQLNGDDLVTQGREDKEKLLYGEGGLIQKLDSLTYDKLAEIEANKAEQLQKQLQFSPMPPKYLISWG